MDVVLGMSAANLAPVLADLTRVPLICLARTARVRVQVPPWCDGSPEDFVRYHRSLLEGERVSRSLHRWLDITFGYCLKGQAAIDNKNVPLPLGGVSGVDVSAGQGQSPVR